MQTTANNHTGPSEVTILARILGNVHGRLPVKIARYILSLGFTDEENVHMQDLAVRN